MSNGEFLVLVAGIVGILIAVCSAARAFLNSAGPLPFIIVVGSTRCRTESLSG